MFPLLCSKFLLITIIGNIDTQKLEGYKVSKLISLKGPLFWVRGLNIKAYRSKQMKLVYPKNKNILNNKFNYFVHKGLNHD